MTTTAPLNRGVRRLHVTRPHLSPILLAIPILGCSGESRVGAGRFDPPTNHFDSILVEQTTLAGIGYSQAYEKAQRKDAEGLSLVLAATIHTDGVGSDTQGQILWNLLQSWGDSAFASILQQQQPLVRTAVRCSLDYTADSSWASLHHRTAALARFNSNCRGD
jgi:hypothetical protein